MKKSMLLLGAMMLIAAPVYAKDIAVSESKDSVPPAMERNAVDNLPEFDFEGRKPNPEMQKQMQQKLVKKLKLSEEQKEQAKKIHEKGMREIEPVIKEIKALHKKAEEMRKANMDEFKSILTEEQLKIFESLPKPPHAKKHHNKEDKGFKKMKDENKHHRDKEKSDE